MAVSVKRPKTEAGIRALIKERERHIAALEKALAVKGLPATTRRHLQHNLRGEKMNRQSWIDYLAKRAA
jgi:hypothetical protein